MYDVSRVPDRFRLLLSKLEKVSEAPGGSRWRACCPAHHDETPSLSVSIGTTGNLVVCCQSPGHGCSALSIVKALGLTMAHLFRDDRPDFKGGGRTQRQPSVVYGYQYEDGRLAYETVRYDEPKEFAQRRPNPEWSRGGKAPRYLWSLDGVRLVPYRLPRLLATWAEEPDRWTVLVEGEKCSDAVESLGVLSTTHALGADNWRAEYAEFFRGRRVAIFYDCDPYHARQKKRPGPAWAVQAARDLYGVAACVRVCRPPGCADDSKEDVADFIAANAGLGQRALKLKLFEAVQSTSDYYPGWENDTGFEALVKLARARIPGLPDGASMNDAIEDTIRKLRAAVDGVRLNTLHHDLAESAAWCAWLATLLAPRLDARPMRLGPSPAPVVESPPAQNSESGGDDAAQEADDPQDAPEALGLPAEAGGAPVEDEIEPL